MKTKRLGLLFPAVVLITFLLGTVPPALAADAYQIIAACYNDSTIGQGTVYLNRVDNLPVHNLLRYQGKVVSLTGGEFPVGAVYNTNDCTVSLTIALPAAENGQAETTQYYFLTGQDQSCLNGYFYSYLVDTLTQESTMAKGIAYVFVTRGSFPYSYCAPDDELP